MSNHLVSHIKHPELSNDNTLHVIGVISNPVRWHSRYRLFRKWKKEMLAAPNVKLYVVEGVYGDHQGECAPEQGEDYGYLQVKLHSEIWCKENMMNIAEDRLLPRNWKYLCWSDCDVHFRDPHWAQGALRALQRYNVLQPWSHCADLDFHGGIYQSHTSFGFLHAIRKKKWHGRGKDGYEYAHTGFAWCCTRYFWENIKKLPDWCIVGSGDHHFAWGLIGLIDETIHGKCTEDYRLICREWQKMALHACGGIVGFIHGTIEHYWHGSKENRNYWGRWNIILSNNFNPRTDLCYDSQGVIKLKGDNALAIEKDMMIYNRSRNEDGEM